MTTITHTRAAADTRAASGALADLVELVEELMTDTSGSRPRARRNLDRVALAAQQASDAIRNTAAPWPQIRLDALVELQRGGRDLPHLFTVRPIPHNNPEV